jgi:hypothetical protein
VKIPWNLAHAGFDIQLVLFRVALRYYQRSFSHLLSIEAHAGGYSTFVELARPFLLVITHSALLDCLSVDTFVGRLYNFISGSNGSRAIPFFRRLSANLLEERLKFTASSSTAVPETTLIAMSIAFRELLRRE